MGYGIRQWNPDNGGLILDTQVDTVNRVFDTVTLDENAGSLTDARFAAGVPFAAIVPYSSTSQNHPKQFSFSGNTMSWTGGPPCSVMYGVGAGNTSYNPVTNGTRAGFQCRTEDGSAITLDETMFALQLIGRGTVSAGSGEAATADVYCPDGKTPVIAVRNSGNASIYLAGVVMIDATTCRITFGPIVPNTIDWYAFGKVYPALSRGIGARWYDNAGTLMGDTSVPVMRILRANLAFNMTAGNEADFTEPAGKKIAVVINEPGFYLYKSAAGGGAGGTGSAGVTIYRAAIRSLNDNSFRASAALIFSSSAGGTNEIRIETNAKFSTVDVTNL